MGKTKISGLDTKSIGERILSSVVNEQTERLAKYAEQEIQQIGLLIKEYNSKNNMDDTGNLLDSLCWGVSYAGKLEKSGFYRSKRATEPSWLHRFSNRMVEVNGHELSERYLQRYGNNGARGWRIFWAILAPYWGYWEKGFTMKRQGTPIKFLQWSVMTIRYDHIKKVLKPPTRKRFRVSVNLYDHEKINEPWD